MKIICISAQLVWVACAGATVACDSDSSGPAAAIDPASTAGSLGEDAGISASGGQAGATGGTSGSLNPPAGAPGQDEPRAGSSSDGGQPASPGTGGAPQAGEAGAEGVAGSGEPPPTSIFVNGCQSFVDRTDEAALRQIPWNDALIFDPIRCMKVRVGQTVLFNGDHDNHPMIPHQGDEPNPVAPVVTFSATGSFGYKCIPHPSEMNGAILVVP